MGESFELVVDNRLQVADNVAARNWINDFEAWWPKWRGTAPEGSFIMNGKRIELIGMAESQEDKQKLVADLGKVFGKGYTIDDRLQVPEPEYPRMVLIRRADGVRVLSGAIPAGKYGQLIGASLAQTEAGVPVDSEDLVERKYVTVEDWVANFNQWWPKVLNEVAECLL